MSSQASFDPGLTQQYTGPLLRTINKDGSFNVVRRGFGNVLGSLYMHLVTISWPQFLSLVAAAYLVVNTIFATAYTALGPEALRTSDPELGLGTFARAFFFSESQQFVQCSALLEGAGPLLVIEFEKDRISCEGGEGFRVRTRGHADVTSDSA